VVAEVRVPISSPCGKAPIGAAVVPYSCCRPVGSFNAAGARLRIQHTVTPVVECCVPVVGCHIEVVQGDPISTFCPWDEHLFPFSTCLSHRIGMVATG